MDQDGAAKSLLKRAVELDQEKRYTEALVCYKEGVQVLMQVMSALKDNQKKLAYREKASQYLERAETLDELIKKEREAGKYHEQIKIEAGSTGNSYENIFGRFLDETVSVIEVEDPYVRSHHQIVNFLRFCELVIKRCSELKKIKLSTSQDHSHENHKNEQVAKFKELRDSLKKRGVELCVDYSDTLHDREIRLDSGWVIKIGRGLDIYKAPLGKMVVGYFDLELRPCHETTVDIFHKSFTKLS